MVYSYGKSAHMVSEYLYLKPGRAILIWQSTLRKRLSSLFFSCVLQSHESTVPTLQSVKLPFL